MGEEDQKQQVDDSVAAMLDKLKLSKKKKKKKKKEEKQKDEDTTAFNASTSNDAPQGEGDATNRDDYTYQLLLDRIYAHLRANNPDLVNKKRAVLRPPEVMRVGTSKILWVNFPEICEMMKRDPEHVFRFFLAELGTTGSIDGNKRFMIKGKYVPKYIESLLKKYIADYVTCNGCKGVHTKLVRDNVSRMYFMNCSTCGAIRAVTSIRAGYHATGRGERRAARQSN
mmetsp:Transcript_16007/g.18084  ORF Transcript_16007/g.18084 Transcript_16007/m.18084 type:complete len:226 (-) Transcript_16007:1433-2110(-)|eukprot:CAMPEP_0204830112 /NCGR_PEP_ID=MMETSP1346-20131115/8339_1 /ASSEMBLY_ACC=CAM_ASM_000771 /TAXON_ID=215587 /ORGANISM="Aplanochytrium stocchinoi, Strain GSBS06" /LENGTH=225 /DNA_ID=CAMNT_0051960249 /DNA_START=263 /DNA_END=943 /DNA_ORIENTATION=+